LATSINNFEQIDSREQLVFLEREYEDVARRALSNGEYFPGFFLCLLRREQHE